MMQPVYETKRLLLKTPQQTHEEQILDYVLRNREFLAPWEPERDEVYFTLEAQRSLRVKDVAAMEAGEMFRVWLMSKAAPGRLIGTAALSAVVRGPFLSCFLGYKLDREETGRGLMTEAVEALVEIGFSQLGLHRIEANIMPRNAASLRVVSKLGFRSEGLSPSYLKINGRWEDHLHMVLLNDRL